MLLVYCGALEEYAISLRKRASFRLSMTTVSTKSRRPALAAFTLVEVMMASVIGLLTIGGIVYGFISSSQRAEWSAYYLAAQNLAIQRLEQTRAAKWDPLAFPEVDELVSANFPEQVHILDVPLITGQTTYATNNTFITQTSTNPAIKLIRVEVAWKFGAGNQGNKIYTNVVATFRAADQ